MINFSIVGREADSSERLRYFDWDKKNKERESISNFIRSKYKDLDVNIGGQISIDIKPKQKLKLFMVSFSESTKKISLDVDGEEYRSIYVKDNLSGNRKFYEGVDKMIKLFSDWGFYENQN